MAVKTREELVGYADEFFPDNDTGEIEPAHVREFSKDIADSAVVGDDSYIVRVVTAAQWSGITPVAKTIYYVLD